MTAPELKPCPFCGGADLDLSVLIGGIFCEGCGADGPWSPAFHGDWNTRAAPLLSAALELPEVRALVEAAEYALRVANYLLEDLRPPPADVYLMTSSSAKVRSLADVRATLAALKGETP